MQEFNGHVKGVKRKSIIIFGIVFAVVVFTYGDAFFMGLAIGIAAGIFNAIISAYQIGRMADFADNPGYFSALIAAGSLFRWSLVIGVFFLVFQTGKVEFLGIILGFVIPLIISIAEEVRSLNVYQADKANN